MKRNGLLTLALASLLLLGLVGLCSCGFLGKQKGGDNPSEASQGQEVASDPGYPVTAGGITLQNRPQLVVSLAPSLTEKLSDLGMEERLAGVSDYCDFPLEVVALPICGTAQLPDLDRLAQLSPNLLITEVDLPDEALAALATLEIPVAVLPRAGTVDQLMDTYLTLARLMDGDSEGFATGEAFVASYRGRLSTMNKALSAYTGENGRKKVLYLRLLDFTVATGDTVESQLMDIICLDNIAGNHSGWRYPESAKADLAGADIIYMDENAVTIKDLEQSPVYKGLPATIKDQYLYISSLSLERQSLRTLDTLEAMAAYAYPEAKFTKPATNDDLPQDDPDDGEDMQDS